MVQWVKDLALSLQWLGSLFCGTGSILGLETSTYCGRNQKKEEEKVEGEENMI